MAKLSNFELQAADKFLSAVPLRSLPGKAVAEVAIAMAVVAGHLRTFNTAVAEIASKLKPEGYDEKFDRRSQQIKEMFPDEASFDADRWEKECPDPEFEEVFRHTEDSFAKAYHELGRTEVNVKLAISADTLGAIAGAIAGHPTVKVDQTDVPYEHFMRNLALLAV